MSSTRSFTALLALTLALVACGGDPERVDEQTSAGDETTVEVTRVEVEREPPPDSGPARDVRFPETTRARTTSGLELSTVEANALPLVYLRLVIRSGDASDPASLPGVAALVAQMLKEGTRSRTSAELAEQIEFLGANLSVGSDSENVYIMIRALSEHLEPAMEILAEIAMHPRFDAGELARLKRRELNRLALSRTETRWLARRAFYGALYGEHPYARTDTTAEVIERISRRDLMAWHRDHVVPNNAFLIAVGDVTPDTVQRVAERAFRGWRSRRIERAERPAPPTRDAREIIVVNRPESIQSVIYVGHLALARRSDDYVPLSVANQILGGSAASRLFMDLRERRSLTYGAYSSVQESRDIAPFIAMAQVRNDVTADAMSAFMEHLERIHAEPPPDAEVADARRFLADSFPLQIETPARIARMVEEQRVYGLPDDYWEGYRSAIREVDAEQAHRAAQQYIRPAEALIVAVGQASAIVEPLRAFGPVRVVEIDGTETARFEALSE